MDTKSMGRILSLVFCLMFAIGFLGCLPVPQRSGQCRPPSRLSIGIDIDHRQYDGLAIAVESERVVFYVDEVALQLSFGHTERFSVRDSDTLHTVEISMGHTATQAIPSGLTEWGRGIPSFAAGWETVETIGANEFFGDEYAVTVKSNSGFLNNRVTHVFAHTQTIVIPPEFFAGYRESRPHHRPNLTGRALLGNFGLAVKVVGCDAVYGGEIIVAGRSIGIMFEVLEGNDEGRVRLWGYHGIWGC